MCVLLRSVYVSSMLTDLGVDPVDTKFVRNVEALMEMTVFLSMKILSIIAFTPLFVFPAVIMAIVSGTLGHVYMKAQLSVKREMSVAKAPVLGHFRAAISGISECIFLPSPYRDHDLCAASIRAYGSQESYKREAYTRIDRYSRVSITNINLSRSVRSYVIRGERSDHAPIPAGFRLVSTSPELSL